MIKSLIWCVIALTLSVPASIGQVTLNEEHYRVFDGKGNPSTLEQVVELALRNDAVFLGELHDDAVGHAVQLEIYRQLVDRAGGKRRVGLTLEMFERDVQVVLDEYLGGLISETHFMASSRPWGNYKTDYRPLVEIAKEKKLPVIAANAPRRYVNMVSRGGRQALDRLSKAAREWLAPLPFGEPSEAYSKKFKALMGPSAEAQMGIDRILASQTLWDATMADSVARFLKDNKGALAVHLNGGFHTESRLGTVEHFAQYNRKAKVIVVTIRYEDDFQKFDPVRHGGLGDFVVLTDAKQPRSKRS